MDQNIFKKFSPSLKQTLITAEKIAVEQKSKMDTEHLLLALILRKNNLANDILQMFDVSIDRAQLVAGLVGKKNYPKNKGINTDTKSAIQLSVQFASKFEHSIVDNEHLLLALISDKTFNSYNIIERMGVSAKTLKNQIESIFSEIKRADETISEQDLAPFSDQNEEFNEGPMPIGPIFGPRPSETKQKKPSVLKTFTINMTEVAKNSGYDPVVGRDNEIERIIQILSRRKKNNPVLIGDSGVGKTAIVEGIAERISKGDVPVTIANKTILALDISALVAGTMYRGQFEARIKKVLDEIVKNKEIILFVDEIHSLIGAGSAEGSMDAANIFKPKLARGEIRVIGATTTDEYRKFIEKDSAFERRFQPVLIKEPSQNETITILNNLKEKYEKHHKVKYSSAAIESAVRLAVQYISDRNLPDKAIDLIDEAGAAVNADQKNQPEAIKASKRLDEINRLKDQAVLDENYEKASILRTEEIKIKKHLEILGSNKSQNGIKNIGEEEIAKVVSTWTGVPVQNLTTLEKRKASQIESKLKKYIVGQDEAIKILSNAIKRSKAGISDPKRPIGSYIFLGPTGVGKTELVKILATEIYGRSDALVKIDMSEFMEKHNVSRLIGAPAGYVGYEDGGKLTEKIRRNPYSIILFDEIEKAHPEVFNLLLQILDDGHLSDAKGHSVDFTNTIIIMTSNLGTDKFRLQAKIGFDINQNDNKSEIDKMSEGVINEVKRTFKPEFINRIDEIIIFNPLSKKSIEKIAEKEVKKLADRLSNKKFRLQVTKNAIKWISEKGFSPEYGARPMKKIISDNIENQISEKILNDEIDNNKDIIVDLSDDSLTISQ